MKSSLYRLFFFLFLLAGCHPVYQTTSLEYNRYQIDGNLNKSGSLEKLIQPYADSVGKSMNEIVGYAETDLDKKQPESLLGNFMCDAVLAMAKKKYGVEVDAAFLNYGGVRLTQLPRGSVTRGKIFELMPFDNLLILQKIKGRVFQEFLDHIAQRNGWPVAGLSMQISNKKAVHVFIGTKFLDPDHEYTIAIPDFIANGGDNADMLRLIPQESNGYLVRDALFDYIAMQKASGKNISAKLENRITYAE